MPGLYFTFQYLYWRRPDVSQPPPPPFEQQGMERCWIPTPGGRLELLIALPSSPTKLAPVLFVHGGMGSAAVWAPYMRYLSQRGIPCYAVSTRGHGWSWHPSFLKMVFLVSKRDLGDDVAAAITFIHEKDGRQLVLVGHSSGGGLVQHVLDRQEARVEALALLGAVPGTGSWKAYRNWAYFDPWFAIRMVLHGWHSNSPLSHPFLIRRAFFSDGYPESKLVEFRRLLNRYESLRWPMTMMYPFVDPRRLLGNISGWAKGDRLLVMAGTEDKLMTKDIVHDTAATYRAATADMISRGRLEGDNSPVHPIQEDSLGDSAGHGVRLAWVPGAGHHLQNDSQWRVGAEKLLSFLVQL